ncbi:MAG: prepilin-type N-terminal cleavage/methylation domain-containing protein [Kiritimatiellaeota bacterium]|nr:prepilin-type N-terminal cleavage/methylation domain-containing protein [Kiritimatiellota bacterium]
MTEALPSKAGFTLSELMVSVTITVLVVTAVLAGFVYLLQGGNMNNNQTVLDMDVHKAIDNLRRDLRLSAVNNILFYPAGPGPYAGISFPMATPNAQGMLTYGTNGLIQWDQTVIYHVWSGQPNQLRKTVFSPRNNARTDAERQEQLNSVVVNGNGNYTFDSNTATTRVIFNNLVNWLIYPQKASFDGYSAVVERSSDFNLGSVLLAGGAHQFKFTVTGKNALNTSGYCKVGLDTFTMSPCGLAREAEAQSPTAQSGATAANEYMANGGWSGNYRLMFPATATGQYFIVTLDNDRWEETNFRSGGALTTNTTVTFDTSLSPYDFVARLEGPGTTWQVTDQTLDLVSQTCGQGTLAGCAVRVLVRGKDMLNGGCLKLDGVTTNGVYFKAGARLFDQLHITAAYIAECSDPTNYSATAVNTGTPLLFNGAVADPTPGIYYLGTHNAAGAFVVDKNKSYLVSFLVCDNVNHDNAAYWVENNAATPGCWILPAALNPDANMTRAAAWTNAVQTNLVFALSSISTSCPTNGSFTSQVVDTHQSAPSYQTISWHSSVPSTNFSLGLRVRSGSDPDAITNAAWSAIITASADGSSAISPGSGRYIQFHAQYTFLPPVSGSNLALRMDSPKRKDVCITWPGAAEVVDLGGLFSKGPDHGVFELTVDGNPLIKGCSMDMTIYKDVSVPGGGTRRMTSTVTTELYPRNTGK